MTFTIGRASFDNAPSAIRHNGDLLDVDINIIPTTLVEAKVLRQQVLGLANNDDEPVVPLTWSDDADYDGFYRVSGVEVEPTQAYLTNKVMRCRLSLERIGNGYSNPVQELYVIGVDASSADIATGAPNTGFNSNDSHVMVYHPSTHQSVDRPTVSLSRTASDGTTIFNVAEVLTNGGSDTLGLTLMADPDEFYDAACEVQQTVGGSWWSVVGRHVPLASTLRVHNGLVRVSVATTGVITTEHWDGAAWQSKSYTITYDSGAGTVSGFNTVRIFRNDPDTAVLRWTGATSADEACLIDVMVQRGHNVAEFIVGTYSAQTWKVTRSSVEAATTITDESSAVTAIRATSNDANGDRFVLSGRATVTADTTNGGITFAASSTPSEQAGYVGLSVVPFGIGYEVGGSSATGFNTAGALAADYQIANFVTRSVAS